MTSKQPFTRPHYQGPTPHKAGTSQSFRAPTSSSKLRVRHAEDCMVKEGKKQGKGEAGFNGTRSTLRSIAAGYSDRAYVDEREGVAAGSERESEEVDVEKRVSHGRDATCLVPPSGPNSACLGSDVPTRSHCPLSSHHNDPSTHRLLMSRPSESESPLPASLQQGRNELPVIVSAWRNRPVLCRLYSSRGSGL